MILSRTEAEMGRQPLTSLFYLFTFRCLAGKIADNNNNREKRSKLIQRREKKKERW